MDASQLYHANFEVHRNWFFDISLLTRICLNNRLGEQRSEGMKFSLGNLALNLLKDSTKDHLLEKLQKHYKLRTPEQVYGQKGVVHTQEFKEYALHDTKLVEQLHHYFSESVNYSIWRNMRIGRTISPRCQISGKRGQI